MRIGIFGDVHDHLDNLRRAVEVFNARGCDLVVFAGDFVSPIAVPPLRQLTCPILSCFGDNEGNKIGIQSGMRILGTVAEPPFGFRTKDGRRILVTHVLEHLRGALGECDVVISGHTHQASVVKDRSGRLFVNPGETSGWTKHRPTVAFLDTATLEAEIVDLRDPHA